ncbi:FecR family protein [Pedobacter nototheniae]|uniref:FecR family protein n=1 Tax=Pedobacter nototheniae TaxID=2488994 RepID=UPI0029304C66|nr:FecR family protein [Pedobacter nototheniae]
MTKLDQIRLQELANKYLRGTLNAAEELEFDQWFNSIHEKSDLGQVRLNYTEDEHRVAIFKEIEDQIFSNHKKSLSLWKLLSIAASFILCFGLAAYFLITAYKKPQQNIPQNLTNDARPGTNKAYLTLSNGKRILLGDSLIGTLANQAGVEITKTAGHQLIYKIIDQPKNQAASTYNTIETPRGGQYQVLLPDGTHVWLNSSSSLKYPTSFASMKTRKVELSGEAYFEVTKNKKIPFLVKVRDKAEILVLGTHFNIMAFDDEPVIKTTLLEGSVKIANKSFNNLLKPGEQAQLTAASKIDINEVDVNEAIAWKNGMFKFKKTKLDEVMRQLARWYDVDVLYPNGIPNTVFTGEMTKDVNASQVLDMLAYFKINYQIIQQSNGKKIIIKP